MDRPHRLRSFTGKTCRMGADSDALAVLTPDLQVRGTSNLRVLDASMMPTIISSNTNATVMAVADRGVDLLMRSKDVRQSLSTDTGTQ